MIKCIFLYEILFFHICVNSNISIVRVRQHQNFEFDHKQGHIKKQYISIQRGLKLKKSSILVAIEFSLVFPFS
jgi:hypothetical protein